MGMSQEEFSWVLGYFQGKGSYCLAPKFALEVFTVDPEPLDTLVKLAGGHIYPPPPASPRRWTWRLYGKEALDLYKLLCPAISNRLRERGDKKLALSNGK